MAVSFVGCWVSIFVKHASLPEVVPKVSPDESSDACLFVDSFVPIIMKRCPALPRGIILDSGISRTPFVLG